MSSKRWICILACAIFVTGLSTSLAACGDDDSDDSNDRDASTAAAAERLDEFVDTCADWHGECIAAPGEEDNPAFRNSCEDDFDRHLDEAVDPEGCVEARLAEWECLTPCPEGDDLVCVEEGAAVNDACKSEDMVSDPPSGSDTPTVDESEFVGACSNYLDVCDPDDGFSTEEHCENMWEIDLANAANPGSCVDSRTDLWICFAEEDCGDGPACMDGMMEMAEHCQQ